jgi:hypothetical protein
MQVFAALGVFTLLDMFSPASQAAGLPSDNHFNSTELRS